MLKPFSPAIVCADVKSTKPVSISVIVLALMTAAIWSPATIERAVELSWALVIVNVSVDLTVTLTISAFKVEGCSPAGQTTALKEAAGNLAPSPLWTTKEVPVVGGTGAVNIVE